MAGAAPQDQACIGSIKENLIELSSLDVFAYTDTDDGYLLNVQKIVETRKECIGIYGGYTGHKNHEILAEA